MLSFLKNIFKSSSKKTIEGKNIEDLNFVETKVQYPERDKMIKYIRSACDFYSQYENSDRPQLMKMWNVSLEELSNYEDSHLQNLYDNTRLNYLNY